MSDPLQNFVDGKAPTIGATWLNKIDAFVNTLFASATTAAQALAALGFSVFGISLGQTANAAAARTLLVAAQSGANTDITSLASPAIAAATATTQPIADFSTKVATTAFVSLFVAGTPPTLSKITASLLANVPLNNTATYFDGPSVAQGVTGTWFASGTVTMLAGNSTYDVKLWDGTTVIASARMTGFTGTAASCSLSGVITSPAGNLRISVKDTSLTTGNILFNATGNSKDSTITALRIA